MDSLLILGAVAIGAAAIAKGKGGGGGGSGASSVQKRSPQATLLNPSASMKAIGLAQQDWPDMVFDIPFAAGSTAPVWPTITEAEKKYVVSYRTVSGSYIGNGARRFMVDRNGDGKYHVGIDLYARVGDPLVAMESGTVVNYYHFFSGTYALFLQCDSGLVINYGEVAKNSWNEFNVQKGTKVKKGYPIARVGEMSMGSHMLHFETYMPPTSQNKQYYGGDTGPILNPTYYLLLAQYLATRGSRAFAGVDCVAYSSMNRPIPERLKPIAEEDKRVGDHGGDSVLPELMGQNMWRPNKDMADGP